MTSMDTAETKSATGYIRAFNELRRERHWSTNIELLRIAALALTGVELDDTARELEETAVELKKGAGWISPLKQSIRYPVAALVLGRGQSPSRVQLEAQRIRKMFRKRNLPHGSVHETLAAFILGLESQDIEQQDRLVKRLSAIMLRWKDDHPIITGANDYPAAALHALTDEDVETLAQRVESMYVELNRAGFGKGNQLQMAAQVLALSRWSPDAAVGRFVALSWAFRDVGFRTNRRRYDELALLALADGAPIDIATEVRAQFDELRSHKPRPWTEVAFSIASGLTLCERSNDLEGAMAAQTVALVACMNSSCVISNNCG